MTDAERIEALEAKCALMSAALKRSDANQQIVARIKRSCKYWGQTAPNQWFDVRVTGDGGYRLRGNDNNYRLGDVVLGVRLDDGSIVDLISGKVGR